MNDGIQCVRMACNPAEEDEGGHSDFDQVKTDYNDLWARGECRSGRLSDCQHSRPLGSVACTTRPAFWNSASNTQTVDGEPCPYPHLLFPSFIPLNLSFLCRTWVLHRVTSPCKSDHACSLSSVADTMLSSANASSVFGHSSTEMCSSLAFT